MTRVDSDTYHTLPPWQKVQVDAVADILRSGPVGAYRGSASDARTDAVSIVLGAQFAPPTGENHHNAAACPYCSPSPARWDKTVPRSLLSDYELQCIAYEISDPLHHTTGIPSCRPSLSVPDLCTMCGNAMRLVVQAAEPKLIDSFITRVASALGNRNINLHPRVADDID